VTCLRWKWKGWRLKGLAEGAKVCRVDSRPGVQEQCSTGLVPVEVVRPDK
jgi:hypothetical protein